MQKVVRDGKVAILYSPGFGAGWHTWNTEYEQLIYHPVLVELIEQNKQHEISEELICKLLEVKENDIYIGGVRNLTIEWLEEGTLFKIDEYDGAEYI